VSSILNILRMMRGWKGSLGALSDWELVEDV
jgi:hypothetical protein